MSSRPSTLSRYVNGNKVSSISRERNGRMFEADMIFHTTPGLQRIPTKCAFKTIRNSAI